MKKIMFDDRFGLTQAVLGGSKTMTRRIEKSLQKIDFEILEMHYDYPSGTFIIYKKEPVIFGGEKFHDHIQIRPRFTMGECVAVAQRYSDLSMDDMIAKFYGNVLDRFTQEQLIRQHQGWNNKMYVMADLMPHWIQITDIKLQRLQDISDEDCLCEGIEEDDPYYWVPTNYDVPDWKKINEKVSDMYQGVRDRKPTPHFWDSPRKAFAALINFMSPKVDGKPVWDVNPYVFVYTFKLIK